MEVNVEEHDGIVILECSGVADRAGTRAITTELDTRIRRREKKFVVDLADVEMGGRDLAAGISSSCTRLRGPETRMVVVTSDMGLREMMEKSGLTRLAYVCRTRQEAEVELGLRNL